jgi:uncharacterized protein YajQ (UPF0234 family)
MQFIQQSLDLNVGNIDSNNSKLSAKTPSKKKGKELIEKQLEAYLNNAIESKLKILIKSDGLKLKSLVQKSDFKTNKRIDALQRYLAYLLKEENLDPDFTKSF